MNTDFPPLPPPLDPILIPDSPGSPTPAVTKRKLSPVAGIDKSAPKPAAPSKPRRPRKPGKFTLEEAYAYGEPSGESRDLEKAIRAASYILNWASDCGNRSVDGFLAVGISRQLDICADEVRRDCKLIEHVREQKQ
jgi:hypothetical protein